MEVHFSEYEQSNTFVMHQVQVKVIKENDVINDPVRYCCRHTDLTNDTTENMKCSSSHHFCTHGMVPVDSTGIEEEEEEERVPLCRFLHISPEVLFQMS